MTVALERNQYLEPKLDIDDRMTMYKMISKLLSYLRPDSAPYHVRTVSLIWALQVATRRSHVESIVAQSLTSPGSQNAHEAYEAFGVLWRLTGGCIPPPRHTC